jgi:hypothetical protein
MQQRSQIPEADDKTTIHTLIKGLALGPTASHLTRKKPKSIDELFHELEEYIKSDEDHHRRIAETNEARQGNRGTTWRPHSQTPGNINNVQNPQFHQEIDQAQEVVLRQEEWEEDPRKFRIMI